MSADIRLEDLHDEDLRQPARPPKVVQTRRRAQGAPRRGRAAEVLEPAEPHGAAQAAAWLEAVEAAPEVAAPTTRLERAAPPPVSTQTVVGVLVFALLVGGGLFSLFLRGPSQMTGRGRAPAATDTSAAVVATADATRTPAPTAVPVAWTTEASWAPDGERFTIVAPPAVPPAVRSMQQGRCQVQFAPQDGGTSPWVPCGIADLVMPTPAAPPERPAPAVGASGPAEGAVGAEEPAHAAEGAPEVCRTYTLETPGLPTIAGQGCGPDEATAMVRAKADADAQWAAAHPPDPTACVSSDDGTVTLCGPGFGYTARLLANATAQAARPAPAPPTPVAPQQVH
jgi:hypothetical protein